MKAAMFVKMAKRFSSGQCLTYDWIMDQLSWPPKPAATLEELVLLEKVGLVFRK